MANGLIGGFGSFGQAQGQQQGNLLGSVFQRQPTRGELRRGLLSEVMQQYGGNAQQTAGAAIGGGLGIGISKLLGRDVQGAERADKIRRVQQQVNQEQGVNFATNPQQAFLRTAELLSNEGLQQEAIQASIKAREFTPDVDRKPATFYNPETDEFVQGMFVNGRPADAQGQALPPGFVQRDFEVTEDKETAPEAIPARFPDGTTGTAYNVAGKIGLQRVIDGKYVPVPRGTTELTSATATPEKTLGSTDKDWITSLSTTGELVDTASRIQTILNERGASAIGFLGNTNQFFASVGAQGRALLSDASVVDEETGESVGLTIENFEDALPNVLQQAGNAENAQRIKTNALRLAYLVAKSSDPTGRVSDADFRAALQRVGGASGDPEQFIAALQEEARTSILSTSRMSGNFLDSPLSPEQLIDDLSNNNVNTSILQGMGLNGDSTPAPASRGEGDATGSQSSEFQGFTIEPIE